MEEEGIEVTVRAPSRLQFGIIDMRGDLGRIHGSVGAAIQAPRLILKATPSAKVEAKGPHAERLVEFAEKIMAHRGVEAGASFEVLESTPEHSGFGSGTQLALSVGRALSEMHGLDLGVDEVAVLLGRARRSGVGVHGFKHGGFIVDGGHRLGVEGGVPPLVFRHDIPKDWLFVVGVPDIRSGFTGQKEDAAFERLEPPPAELVGEVSRVVLMQMIPGIIDGDIVAFGEAMTALDRKFGEYWMEVQGGIYTHPAIESCVNHLLENDAYGAGQSSWGPALYGLAKGRKMAVRLSEGLRDFLVSEGLKGEAFITMPDNRGAMVTVSDD